MAEQLILRWSDPELLHRARNMGEDLWGALGELDEDILTLAHVDEAKDHFVLKVRRNDLGTVQEIVRGKLKRHNLEADVRVERA